MSSRFVFCFSATWSFTSWPSEGPVTSSRTTVKGTMPAGIFGWSQQTCGPAGCSVLHDGSTNSAASAAPRTAIMLRGRKWERIDPPGLSGGEAEGTSEADADTRLSFHRSQGRVLCAVGADLRFQLPP